MIAQRVSERVMVLLLSTAKEGAAVVQTRLRSLLSKDGPETEVLGPVTYPEDGTSGKELLTRLSANQTQRGE